MELHTRCIMCNRLDWGWCPSFHEVVCKEALEELCVRLAQTQTAEELICMLLEIQNKRQMRVVFCCTIGGCEGWGMKEKLNRTGPHGPNLCWRTTEGAAWSNEGRTEKGRRVASAKWWTSENKCGQCCENEVVTLPFKDMSGPKINFSKSEVNMVFEDIQKSQSYSELFNCMRHWNMAYKILGCTCQP